MEQRNEWWKKLKLIYMCYMPVFHHFPESSLTLNINTWRTILLLENEEYIKMYNSCVKKWKINTMNK